MRVILSILIIVVLVGCEDKIAYKKPEGLLDKETMTNLLYDMHLVVGTSNLQNVHLEKNRNYMSLVYEKYGIDSIQFAASNLYYTSHIQEYEDIFEEVQLRLELLKAVYDPPLDSLVESERVAREAQRKRDSTISSSSFRE